MKVSEYTARKQIEQGIKKNEVGTVMGVTSQAKTDFDWVGNFPLGEKELSIKANFKIQDDLLSEHELEIERLKKEIITLKHIVYDLLEQQETDMKGEF